MKPKISHKILFVAILIPFLVGATFLNLRFARANPGGNDFLTRWVAARSFLIEGLSPYSDEVALQIQLLAYGRPARPGEDQMRMAYPFYALALFAPYAFIEDYAAARALWMTTLEASAILFALLSARLTNWKPEPFNAALWILFAVLGYHSVRAVINGNVVLFIAMFMVLALWFVRAERDVLAAAFLTLTTVKPQLAVLFITGIFVWCVSQRRWKLVMWTAYWGIGLVLLGMLFIPDWVAQNLSDVIAYPSYTTAGTVQAALAELYPIMGRWLGWAITVVMSLWLIYEWRAMWGQPFEEFLTAVCATLVASQWIGIQTDPGNFIILSLPLVLVFAWAQARWKKSVAVWIGVIIVSLLLGLWTLFLVTVQGNLQSPFMFLPMPAVLIGGWMLVRLPGLPRKPGGES